MSHGLVLNDRYRLEERLATGGMGEVWRAADQALAREVAVKLLRPELMSDASARERFRSEARFAGALRHGGIAQVYDAGTAPDETTGEDRAYLVMELVRGEPLAEIIARAGTLPADAVLDLVAQSGRALAAAHAAGIVHRDIKPANLMVTRDGTIKITDFGIARRLAAESQTRTGMVMGTAYYISPEQASGQEVTPSADLYSLGVVAFECLAGRVPFEGWTPVDVALQQVRDAPPPLPAGVPAPVRDLVGEMLAKDPSGRPADADEVADRALIIRDSSALPGTGLSRWSNPPTATPHSPTPNTRPDGRPVSGSPSDAGDQPATGGFPAEAGRPSTGDRPTGEDRPATADQPGTGGKPAAGERSATRGFSAGGGWPSATDRSATGGRSAGEDRPAADDRPAVGRWSAADGRLGAGASIGGRVAAGDQAGRPIRKALLDGPARVWNTDGAGPGGPPGGGRDRPRAWAEFDGEPSPDSLTPGKTAARRRAAVTYASVAAGTLLLGVFVVGTMWRGLGTAEPQRENQERLPAVQPGEGDPARPLPADPATRLHERRGQETRPSPTRDRRTSTPRYHRASPSHKPTRKPPRATPSAPDPTPRPTESTTTPSTPSPGPSPTESRGLGSEDKV
ncbi:hypothetical protein GCM10010191_88230 [Actinomadura vinacea]|uniref:non-specific serine/threonine protein kinase n=1 Tax=Actinomadura vinacea TaxID=115336 RepID=A0ABN3KFI0_9ACTN